MTVKELKRFLRGIEDDTEIYISITDSNKVLHAVELSVEPNGEMYIECDYV